MNPVHDGLDLNLLATLDVLLQERSVTRAAKVQGVTQSAMSHRLRQLRDVLGDPLFVRTAQGLVPTERARALMEPLRAAIVNVRLAIDSERVFDPKTARKTFVIATSDYVEFLMLPGLMEPLSREAPGIELRLAPLPPVGANLADLLARGGSHGGFDLAFAGPRIEAQAGLRTLRLPADPFVVVVRKDHPRIHRSLSLTTFVQERHILIAPNNRPGGVVDELLEQRGLRRHVAVTTRFFTVAPFIAARSDLLLTAPALLIGNMLDVLPLKTFKPPLPLNPTVGHMVWHERSQEDAAHRWFRVFLKEQTGAIAAKLLKQLAMAPPRTKKL